MSIFLGLTCFNSIKVRLRRNVQPLFCKQIAFQFHKGAIKTRAGWTCLIYDNVSIP